MATSDLETYPRPDFERKNVHWQSLNGSWDFLFDDQDVGLLNSWQQNGLPVQVDLEATEPVGGVLASESESITQKIAAGTQNLIKNNVFASPASKTNHKRSIQVPFVFQCPASGINEKGVHEVLWYERSVTDLRTHEEREKGYKLLLRFGAVDYEATVWLDGQYVGSHQGGHVPFDIDITDAVKTHSSAIHRLTIRVFDSAHDLTQPRGKQYWGAKPESIFYTPSGGIWQSVWLESIPAARIADSSHGTILRSDDIDAGQLHANIAVLGRRVGQKLCVKLEASLAGVPISKLKADLPGETNSVTLDLDLRLTQEQLSALPSSFLAPAPESDTRCWFDGLALWSPEYPLLYDLTLLLLDSSGQVLDEVNTTTGMRSLDWTSGPFKINKRPYFQALCLDQGYWPSSFMTPPNFNSLKTDIVLAKAMGFNGCRKHQKVEDPIFHYWADRLGYLVWGEMANAYQFSSSYATRFSNEWTASVLRDINHPSIVTWTPVNESWGYPALTTSPPQRSHIRQLYHATKTLDPSRPVNDNCGWEHVATDLTTFHDYADGAALTQTCAALETILQPKSGRAIFVPAIADDAASTVDPRAPVICTEFGGVNIATEPDAERVRDWGYTTATDAGDLLARIERLVLGIVEGGVCCGFVYTQLADIEQEANGLYTFDRKPKLEPAKVKALMDRAREVFYEKL